MAFIGLSKPKQQNIADTLNVGDVYPASTAFSTDKPYALIAFLRHVGCPFAENTVKQLRHWSSNHDNATVFIVSHGDVKSTESWIKSIGGLGGLQLVVDDSRELYGRWGIGYSHLRHFLGLPSLMGVITLFFKGIRNRDACGTRWQKSSMFVVDDKRILWTHEPSSAQGFMLPPERLLF